MGSDYSVFGSDLLEGIELKLARADQHLEDIKAIVDPFRDPNAIALRSRFNRDRTREFLFVHQGSKPRPLNSEFSSRNTSTRFEDPSIISCGRSRNSKGNRLNTPASPSATGPRSSSSSPSRRAIAAAVVDPSARSVRVCSPTPAVLTRSPDGGQTRRHSSRECSRTTVARSGRRSALSKRSTIWRNTG